MRLSLCQLAVFSALAALGNPAFAGSGDTPSLTELRDRMRFVEERRAHAIHEIENRQATQGMEADEAVMAKARAERDYKNDMYTLQMQEAQVLQAMDEKNRPKDSRAPSSSSNPAIPKFQSQTVIEYPAKGSDSDPSNPGAQPTAQPIKEGRQKNVGLGTREIEF